MQLALPSRFRPKRFRSRVEPKPFQMGSSLSCTTMTFIPADTKLRPLRDQMIVEPLEVVHSRYLIIPEHGKPIRGTCRAIGPGHYRKQYDHPDKHKRTKMWEGTHYVPTEVKVGDIVHLGGAELGGYAFEQFWWGDKLHIHCREADVAGIEC